ncbi:hypothetical protein SELSPUOL_01049 [Selenomonas sputigena ATCC 35185]|uniref:Uncharacterized protein n=1 Tax=Selenomonas sputigena (strain ATCC 35185 / DSM 20758 / CCUG 44933 / VPI D19B-28) TaxID=546271 RepID=C9LTN8_SELS3|nr:hypothetical protein SELSPUOL_01049 [Selenomonas sputigena ATCC 35185]
MQKVNEIENKYQNIKIVQKAAFCTILEERLWRRCTMFVKRLCVQLTSRAP